MKKLIETFIQHLLSKCRKNDKRYIIARLLAELVKDKEKTDWAYTTIADYFIENEGGALFDFDDIFVVGDYVYIRTIRPGYWIGKRGSVADKLTDMLNRDCYGNETGNYELRFLESIVGAKAYIMRMVATSR